jgi:Acetyltransferase (GNAT) domain
LIQPDFQLRPFTDCLPIWQHLLAGSAGATLYHRISWIELVFRSYHLPIWMASLRRDGVVVSGCILARSRNPFTSRLVSLPFSDNCPPLMLDGETPQPLLDVLAAQSSPATAYEIRGGSAAAWPWHTVECFVTWRLDLTGSLSSMESALDANFRRNLRRASQQDVKIERGNGTDFARRFYALQLAARRHLGLPPQPRRFFELMQEIFAPEGNLEIWIAGQDGRDLAGAVFIRDGGIIYYKWGARRPGAPSSANHLLFWNAIEEFTTSATACDLGRTDVRNAGLMRFKKALGATAIPLPYSYYPHAPGRVSSEVLTGSRKILAGIWKRLPIPLTEVLGGSLYGFLA